MLGMLCIFGITMAQNSDEHAIYPTALPADTWNFIQYGNFDTNPYTGTVSISIPIYTYEDPDFKFPISLHYGSNGMVPNRIPGIVGHDWNLNIGGVITRTVRGIPDDVPYNGQQEFWTTPFMLASPVLITSKVLMAIGVSDVYGFTSLPGSPQNVYGFAYMHLKEPMPVFSGSGEDIFFPMYVFSKSLTEPLITLYGRYENPAAAFGTFRTSVTGTSSEAWYQEPPKAMFYDTQPDLFHFNVCGYSGDFTMGLCNEVKVFNTNVPAGEISVAFENDALDGNNSALDPLGKDGNRIPYGGWKRIVITVGDGTKFIFKNEMSNWIGSIKWDNLNVAESAGSRSRNAWHLSSIEAINGRKVTLEYDRVESSSKNPPLGGLRYGLDSEGYSWPDFFVGQLIPLLKNVVVDNDSTITLTYERYDNNTKTRLKSIIIKHKSKDLKTASLNYINQFYGKNLFRSFLRSVSVSGEGEYQMEYLGIDSSLVVNAPEVGTLKLDHWGYYNARNMYLAELDYDSSGEEVINERYHQSAPDSTSAKFGMLSKMKWPTGGYTKYTYEANRYDKVVVLDTIYNDKYRIGEAVRDITNKLPSRTVGGLRIKKIENYDKSNVLTGFKEFRYNIGLLCKEPFHVAMFEMVAAPETQLSVFNPSDNQQTGYLLSGNIKVSGDIMSSDFNQIGQYHIVYPDVTEIHADGSYTRYEYLSFLDSDLRSFNSEKRVIKTPDGEALDADFFAKSAFEEINKYYIYSPSPGIDMYYANGIYNRNARVYQKLMWKSSVNDLGFGKPKMITSYNSSNQVVCQKKFEYNLSASKNTLWYPQTPLTGPGGGGRYIGMKPSIAESPLLIKETETLYYNGEITINKQTEYKYNDSHQLIKRIETSSSSDDVFETNYVYPLNFRVDSYSPNSGGIKTIYTYPSGSVGIMAKKMVDKNVVNKPLSNDQMVNGNQTQKIDYTYVQSGNLINLAQISQTSNDGQLVLQTNVEYYDSKGRPLQVRYPDGKVETIVWGYGGRFVAARIENKTKAQVESLIGSLQIPLVGTLDYQKEKTLRGVSDAYVTTYEYLDGVGISRITQPDGTSAFFVYNTDGKLVGAFDTNGNPVSSVNYNIQK
jgi:hypothetical protein